MKKTLWFASLAVIGIVSAFSVAQAKPRSVEYGGKTYYVVTSEDAAMDSGNEVCAAAGKTCVGYTAYTLEVCTLAHPGAKKATDANGSKAGFYCNGAPQGGVCAGEQDTCHVCPNCNVNADCSTQIGDLYREMYVECSGEDQAAQETVKLTGVTKNLWGVPGRWWGSFRSTVARAFDLFREKLARLTIKKVKHVRVQVQGPKGMESADVPEDSYVCEFYQQNKKLATCGALAAADHFCVTAMDSRFATAVLCQENGLIVCAKPCKTNPQELKPERCAFDGDRPRGNQAPPLDFCTETVTVDTKTGPTKEAGEVCAHGGECNTGFCLGQPSDNGIKYFCSCKQNVLDFTCGK